MMYDVESARQRDGDAAEDRSERVDEILTRPRLGHGESDPLVGDDYDEYPEQPDDLTTPEARPFVSELFASPLVSNLRDAVEETTPATGDSQIVQKWRDAFERATEVFGVETQGSDDERDERATDDRLAELTPDVPDDMVTPSNPLVVAHMYADGLSCDEIAEVFSDDSDTRVKASQIRRVLRSTGLITAGGEDSEPSHRLGGASMSLRDTPSPAGNSGVNINTEAVARDPNVSVERNSSD